MSSVPRLQKNFIKINSYHRSNNYSNYYKLFIHSGANCVRQVESHPDAIYTALTDSSRHYMTSIPGGIDSAWNAHNFTIWNVWYILHTQGRLVCRAGTYGCSCHHGHEWSSLHVQEAYPLSSHQWSQISAFRHNALTAAAAIYGL